MHRVIKKEWCQPLPGRKRDHSSAIEPQNDANVLVLDANVLVLIIRQVGMQTVVRANHALPEAHQRLVICRSVRTRGEIWVRFDRVDDKQHTAIAHCHMRTTWVSAANDRLLVAVGVHDRHPLAFEKRLRHATDDGITVHNRF